MAGRLSAVRHRPWQALVLVCLSAVVAGTALLAPLYDRALQQAMVRDLVSNASTAAAGVSVRSSGVVSDGAATLPYAPSRLLELFPASARRYFDEPISTLATSVEVTDPGRGFPVGLLMNRDRVCEHIEVIDGTCPTGADEIAISEADADTYGWSVGEAVNVAESSPLLDAGSAHRRTLEVVGVYTTDPDQKYWASRPPVGRSGFVNADGVPQHDGWLTAIQTLTGVQPQRARDGRWSWWSATERTVDLLLDRDRVGVDELFELSGPVDAYLRRAVEATDYRAAVTATAQSGIPDLVARAEAGREHAHVLVPLFIVQLALLAALTLWLVLGAAVEQRRPEVAVVRLWGGDARSSRRLLHRELGPPVLAGGVLGMLTASGAALVVGRQWLDPELTLEITTPVVLTAVGVLVVEVLMLVAATWSTARANPAALLRRVRPRTGWAVSLGPALLVVMCGAAFAATAAGSLSGWVAMAAPTLLAIATGLLLAHLLGPVAGGAGSRLLGRGRLVLGLSLLQVGRRHGSRTAIATIVAAAALLAFAVNALSVGERNRDELARATVGAPAVVEVEGIDLAAVRAAVRDLDPTGETATVVALAGSSGEGMSTMAVTPEEFARVAAFDGADDARRVAGELEAPGPAPIELQGTQLTLEASWRAGRDMPTDDAPRQPPVDLDAFVVRPDVQGEAVPLEVTAVRKDTLTWSTDDLPCPDGCLLTGIVVNNRVEDDVTGVVTVRSAEVAGEPLPLGDQDDWADATPHSNGTAAPRPATEGMAFRVHVTRGFDARLGHGSVPPRLAAVTSGALPPDAQEADFTSVGLDGVLRAMRQVATQPYLPGAPRDTALVDLEVLARDGVELDPSTRLLVYLDDSVDVDAAQKALDDHGIAVETVSRISERERDYERTAPAWALQLGVVVAGAAALLAALVLAISFSTSWRLRAADSVAVRLNGVSHRRASLVSLLETVPIVLLSAVLGVACGVVGSRIALPDLPFFDAPPELPVEDLATSWGPVLTSATLLLVALAVLGTLMSAGLGRRRLSQASEGD